MNPTDKCRGALTGPSVVKAHLAIFSANLCWGINSPVTKAVLLDGTIEPLALSAIRIGGAAVIFLILSMILPPSAAPRERIEKSDIWKLIAASVLMISVNQGLYIVGVGFTNPIDSAVMCSVTPLITMIFAAWFLHYPVTRLKLLGVLIGMGGVIMLVWGNRAGATASNPVLGDLMCLGAQVAAALYYVLFIKLINRYHPFTLMKWMFFISAVTYVPLCSPSIAAVDFPAVSPQAWLGVAFIIIFATVLGYLAIPYAQRQLKPTVVSIYNYVQPVAAAIVSVWLGIGSLGFLKLAAIALIFAGVYFVTWASQSPKSSAGQTNPV